MTDYIIRRLFFMVITLLGITLVVMGLTRLLPGGPVEQRVAMLSGTMTEGGSSQAAQEMRADELDRLRAYYGLDQPFLAAYGSWLRDVLRGDLGESWSYREPVAEVIADKFPISLFFGVTSLILTYLVSIPLGVSKALKNNTPYDTVTSIIVFVGYVIPGFALGVLLIVFLGGGNYLDLFPISGVRSDDWALLPWHWKILDFLHHMILPLICYMVGQFAVLTMLMKNSLLEEINRDYMRTAMAKGVPSRVAIWKHALRNALIPIVTGIGAIFTVMFASSLLIEKVFEIDGMGMLFYTSIIGYDYQVVMGIILLMSLAALLGRLFSDIMYVVVDPRIRFD
jgi:microcin C transport system permease protein